MEDIKVKGYWIFVFVSLLLVFAGCGTMQETLNLKKPTARLMGLKFEDVKLDSAKLLFDVEIDNRYPVALPLTNLQTTVPAKSKKIVALPAEVNYMEILKALKGVRPGAKIPYSAQLGLSVDTPALGVIRLPLKKEGELVLPTVSGTGIDDIWNIIKPK